MTDLFARERAALMPTYARRPVVFVSGHGPWLVDADGREHLDFLTGLAVAGLGHAHPEVADAIAAQARTLMHTSNLFLTRPQVELAERLKATLGWDDALAFLCNSGAEANEGALKLARRHGKAQREDKVGVVAVSGGFHGRTLAALLATGNPAKHAPFQPLGDWVTHVPLNDVAALDEAVGDTTCAVLLEVVQGEGGVHVADRAFLETARAACDRVGALLIVDEVQTGMGRLGAWYGWQTTGRGGHAGAPVSERSERRDGGLETAPVVPDVVCLAKALANGLPIGAIVARGAAARAFGPGDHGSTFGGGPVTAAAAIAVLDIMERDGVVENARRMGERLTAVLTELGEVHDVVAGVRGRGLLQALVLREPVAGDITGAALEEGLVVNDVAPDAIRLAPPLIIGEAELGELSARLGRAMVTAGSRRTAQEVRSP
jgi:acetylornithine/N-succinyldiaminopimelate aminotransferase